MNSSILSHILFTDEHELKTNIWYRMIRNHVLRPYELPHTLNGRSYLNLLQQTLPMLMEDLPLNVTQTMIFMQDGAPTHFSPDFNPLDFSVWGIMKSFVYNEPIETEKQLREKIMNSADFLKNERLLFKIRHSFIKRIAKCIEVNGEQYIKYFGTILNYAIVRFYNIVQEYTWICSLNFCRTDDNRVDPDQNDFGRSDPVRLRPNSRVAEHGDIPEELLENSNLHLTRRSLDKTVNARGRSILEFMNINSICLLNGRTPKDRPAQFTHSSRIGNSVIDLVWVNNPFLSLVNNLYVNTVVTMSDHFPINLTLNLTIQQNTNKNNKIRPSSSNTIKWDRSMSLQYKFSMQCSKRARFIEDIQLSFENFCSAIKETAVALNLIYKKKSFARYNRFNAPWFDAECRIAKLNAKLTLKTSKEHNFASPYKQNYQDSKSAYIKLIKQKKTKFQQSIIHKLSNSRDAKTFWSTLKTFRQTNAVHTIPPAVWENFYKNIYPPRLIDNTLFYDAGNSHFVKPFTTEIFVILIANNFQLYDFSVQACGKFDGGETDTGESGFAATRQRRLGHGESAVASCIGSFVLLVYKIVMTVPSQERLEFSRMKMADVDHGNEGEFARLHQKGVLPLQLDGNRDNQVTFNATQYYRQRFKIVLDTLFSLITNNLKSCVNALRLIYEVLNAPLERENLRAEKITDLIGLFPENIGPSGPRCSRCRNGSSVRSVQRLFSNGRYDQGFGKTENAVKAVKSGVSVSLNDGSQTEISNHSPTLKRYDIVNKL
ncbi:hypothetical protein FQR65_LT14079 [Abscondita terminalis]|nr:hypothetical protein FQR65_LT14079 [Abscondita terminalis]